MTSDDAPKSSLSGARHSKSGEQSRRAELERIRAMTPLQRMALAFALGRRDRSLGALRGETIGDDP